MKRLSVLFCVALIGSSLSVYGQEGFNLGLDFPLVSFPSGDIHFNPGFGMGLRVGYGIDENLSLSLNLAAASHTVNGGSLILYDPSSSFVQQSNSYSEWNMGWLFFDGKFLFGETGRVRPFIIGELGLGVLAANSDNSLSGVGVGAGGGVEYYVADHLSLNGTAFLRYTNFSKVSFNGRTGNLTNSLNESAFSLNTGLTYHF